MPKGLAQIPQKAPPVKTQINILRASGLPLPAHSCPQQPQGKVTPRQTLSGLGAFQPDPEAAT